MRVGDGYQVSHEVWDRFFEQLVDAIAACDEHGFKVLVSLHDWDEGQAGDDNEYVYRELVEALIRQVRAKSNVL